MLPVMPVVGRAEKIMIRVSAGEKRQLELAASQAHLSTSSWARHVLLRDISGARLPLSQGVRALSADLDLLSLFCGPGGLDQGFRRAGFATRVAFDVDRDCVRTFNHNHANGEPIAHQRDLRALTLREVLALAGEPFAPIGVIGGPPCQSFSVSNVHQHNDDPRHLLPFEYARLLLELSAVRPVSFFLFENVPGLLGAKHLHRYIKFKKTFAKANFEIFEETLDTANYGIPKSANAFSSLE